VGEQENVEYVVGNNKMEKHEATAEIIVDVL
jgi:hypothetical protein